MIINRTSNAIKGIGYGFVNKIATILMPFLVRTVMIRTLGVEYLGINSLFTSILSVLSLAELGFGSAVVYSMYKPIADGDDAAICALLGLYRKVYTRIGGAILLIGVCLTPLLPALAKGGYPDEVNIYVVYYLYLFKVVLTYWCYAYKNCLLNAFQRRDVISNIGTTTCILSNAAQIGILIGLKNIYLSLFAVNVFTIIGNIITSICVNRIYPSYKCCGQVDASVLTDLKKKVAGAFIGKVCAMTRNTFDMIYISAFLGLEAAAIYGNYYYIMNAIIGVLGIIPQSLLAGVGNSIALESREKVYDDFKVIDFIFMIIAGWCAVCLACLYQPFMELWMGKENIYPFRTMILFVVYFYIHTMGTIRSVYADAAGLFWENRNRYIAEAVSNVVLNYVFVVKWGVNGVIGATILTLLFFGFAGSAKVIFKKFFTARDGLLEYFFSHLAYFIITMAVVAITYYICSLIDVSSKIVILILKMLVCCTIPVFMFYFMYRKTRGYKNAMVWVWVHLKVM